MCSCDQENIVCPAPLAPASFKESCAKRYRQAVICLVDAPGVLAVLEANAVSRRAPVPAAVRAATGLRVAAIGLIRDMHAPPALGPCGADCIEFDTFARNLAEGRGYTNSAGRASAFRAPGFPILLASLYAVIGPSPFAAYLLLAALGGLAAVIGLNGCRLRLPEPARIVGADGRVPSAITSPRSL
jgi:hypothetical protein